MFDDLELNVVTYTLIALVLGLMILPVIFQKDPDIHPMILNRQSNMSPFVALTSPNLKVRKASQLIRGQCS